MIWRFPRNTAGRDIIVGDIHGKWDMLSWQLEEIGFDQRVDRLFSVGDMVDRGPDSEAVLEWLALPWFHAVQGNHEQMACLYAAGDWPAANYAVNGGAWMIGKTPAEQQPYVQAFMQLPLVIEIETAEGLVGVVHAACDFPTWSEFKVYLEDGDTRTIENTTRGRARFTRVHQFAPVDGVRAVVVGHNMTNGIQRIQNVIHIDTAVVDDNFTLLNAATLEPEVRK